LGRSGYVVPGRERLQRQAIEESRHMATKESRKKEKQSRHAGKRRHRGNAQERPKR